jgi:hypothetical protein
MKEHTLKEVQETCERIGAKLRFVPNASPKYLTGETRTWVAVLVFGAKGTTVIGQAPSMDEAFANAVTRAEQEKRFG